MFIVFLFKFKSYRYRRDENDAVALLSSVHSQDRQKWWNFECYTKVEKGSVSIYLTTSPLCNFFSQTLFISQTLFCFYSCFQNHPCCSKAVTSVDFFLFAVLSFFLQGYM